MRFRRLIITPTSLPALIAIDLTCSVKFGLSSIMIPKSFIRLVGSIGTVSSSVMVVDVDVAPFFLFALRTTV